MGLSSNRNGKRYERKFFDGDFKADPVNRSYFVDYSMFMIPPNGTVVFEVGVLIGYSISQFGHDDGNIHADFTNGDREVSCPAVWIQILT